MGFMGSGGLLGNLKDAVNGKLGEVGGFEFPLGTFVNAKLVEGEHVLCFNYPNKEVETITHDMVKCATVLAMGVIDIENNNKGTTMLYGTKYLCVLKDGRQAVLTVGLGKGAYMIERVLF